MLMGALKDIVDLTKDLESRAKERRELDLIHKIQALAFSFQSSYADVVERDVRLMEENAELKKKLAEAQSEDVRVHGGLEFRKSKKTGDVWTPFCPKCGIPLFIDNDQFEVIKCRSFDDCGWWVHLTRYEYQRLVSKLSEPNQPATDNSR